MGMIRRIFPVQSGAGVIEYAVVMSGVLLTIVVAIATHWLAVD
jgi:hypothetical protein